MPQTFFQSKYPFMLNQDGIFYPMPRFRFGSISNIKKNGPNIYKDGFLGVRG